MATDDERREVARRMSDAMRRKYDFCAHNVAIEMGMADPPDYDGPFNAYHMLAWKSLADLIDPGEPKVKCIAEVKIDGERLEELAHDAAVELTGIDRDALLALADEIERRAAPDMGLNGDTTPAWYAAARMQNIARRIREALGVVG